MSRWHWCPKIDYPIKGEIPVWQGISEIVPILMPELEITKKKGASRRRQLSPRNLDKYKIRTNAIPPHPLLEREMYLILCAIMLWEWHWIVTYDYHPFQFVLCNQGTLFHWQQTLMLPPYDLEFKTSDVDKAFSKRARWLYPQDNLSHLCSTISWISLNKFYDIK